MDRLKALRVLDARRVSDDERRVSALLLRREDEKRRDLERSVQQVGLLVCCSLGRDNGESQLCSAVPLDLV